MYNQTFQTSEVEKIFGLLTWFKLWVFQTEHFRLMGLYPLQLYQVVQVMDSELNKI